MGAVDGREGVGGRAFKRGARCVFHVHSPPALSTGIDYNDPVVLEAVIQQYKSHTAGAMELGRPVYPDATQGLKECLDIEVEAEVAARLAGGGGESSAVTVTSGYHSSLGTYVLPDTALHGVARHGMTWRACGRGGVGSPDWWGGGRGDGGGHVCPG